MYALTSRLHARRSQRGVALMVTMMSTIAITGMAITALWTSSINLRVAQNLSDRQVALYAAEAGMQRANFILSNSPAPWTALLGNPGAAGSGGTGGTGGSGGSGGSSCSSSPPTVLNLTTACTPALSSSAVAWGQAGNTGQGFPTSLAEVELPWKRGVVLRDPAGACLLQINHPYGASDTDRTGRYDVFVRNNKYDIVKNMVPGDSPTNYTPDNNCLNKGLVTDGDSMIVVQVVGWSKDNKTKVVLEATLRSGGASSADATYGGINENNENSNSIATKLDYSGSVATGNGWLGT